MLSKKDIEELATGAVKRYFNTCNLISPQIQENDKTPDWDGELNLYETKKDIRKNYIGSLRIQVKGKEVSKFKTKETFPIETIFLRNAKNEGFVFFVVEVMSNGDNKIFYKKMAPIEIRGLLATINKQQKTRSMPFEPLSMDKSWTEAELKAFLSDCIKQKSFASKNPFSIEDVKNVHDYQWGFTFQGKKNNLLKDFLGGFKSFLYLKTKEDVEIPIGNGLMNIFMPELTIKKEESVYIGNDIVASNYVLTYTKESVSYKLENLFLLKSEQKPPSTKRISTLEILADTTDEQIKAYEIYKLLIEYGSIKFGDTEITINASNKNVLLSTINKQLSNLSIHQAVLNALNITTPINYKVFTEKDDFSMHQLYKAFIENKAIDLQTHKVYLR